MFSGYCRKRRGNISLTVEHDRSRARRRRSRRGRERTFTRSVHRSRTDTVRAVLTV